MKTKILLGTVVAASLLSSCASNKNMLWVSGIKVEQANGAGKSENYMINRSTDPTNGSWENFYNNIDGFEYTPGVAKRIKVKETNLDAATVPADGSTIKYSFEELKETTVDHRYYMNGDWTLVKINNGPINRMVTAPTLTVDASQKTLSGSDGCNNYQGRIMNFGLSTIEVGPMVSTKKACIGKDMAQEYYAAWEQVSQYSIDKDMLTFKDSKGNPVLTFLKPVGGVQIDGMWTAVKMEGGPISRMNPAPTLMIDTKANTLSGNNSCNPYNAAIVRYNGNTIVPGNIIAGQKMCFKNETAGKYMQLLDKVTNFKIENKELILFNANGQELLRFIK